MSRQIELAKEMATKYHSGQKRSDGKDYITHCEAVFKNCKKDFYWLENEDKMEMYVAAWLHDTLEDTKITKDTIRKNFGIDVLEIVELVSKKKNETYFDFIKRIAESKDIRAVALKLSDLKHNMSDLTEGSLRDKYRFAFEYLERYI